MRLEMSMSDDFLNTPFWRGVKLKKQLLETLKEMHSGELFALLRLQEIADKLTAKAGQKFSAIKVAAMIRQIFGDHVIEKHKSRYFAAINIDTLNRIFEDYQKFKL
jgi:hypothetical protein